MKFGKNEKKVLVLLLIPYGNKYCKLDKYNNILGDLEQGKSIGILADEIYGYNAREKYVGLANNYNLLNKVNVSLSRSLNNLHKKKLVMKLRPIYERKWNYEEDEGCGFMYNRLIGLKYFNGNNYDIMTVPKYSRLPAYTHIWWILTEKGEELAKKLALKNPKLDEMINFYMKKQIEKKREKLWNRCYYCKNYRGERYKDAKIECSIDEMKGKELTTENCEYYEFDEYAF